MSDIKTDLSTLTTIPRPCIDRLAQLVQTCICHDLCECVWKNETCCEINLDIGTLYISIDDSIHYKFIPSQKFDSLVRSTILNKKSPLEYTVENTLAARITNTYKDMI